METHNDHISALSIFRIFLKLGLTSFGGPIAHLGYFRHEFVERRQWLNDHAYADLVALCQFLPGPASSQVGIALGLSRGGYIGALAAWAGFTLPSALLLLFFAWGMHSWQGAEQAGWLHGLKIATVAVVAQALWGMARTIAPDRARATIAVIATIIVLALSSAGGQIAAIVMGGLSGYVLLKNHTPPPHVEISVPIKRGVATLCLLLFLGLLIALPLLAGLSAHPLMAVLDVFYRAGALVFGGGHVVLPLLQTGVVAPGWISNDQFLAGYGAAQAVPGPLFTFAAYLGAIMEAPAHGLAGAALCLAAIFLPSFLLVFGALPFWERLRQFTGIQSSLRGINAAVVGILLAALYNPVWLAGITSAVDFAIGIAAFLLLSVWKCPPWLVVGLCAAAGFIGI